MPLEILFLLFFLQHNHVSIIDKEPLCNQVYVHFFYICKYIFMHSCANPHHSSLTLFLLTYLIQFKSKLIHQSGFLFSEMTKRKRQHHIMCGWYHFPVFFSMS